MTSPIIGYRRWLIHRPNLRGHHLGRGRDTVFQPERYVAGGDLDEWMSRMQNAPLALPLTSRFAGLNAAKTAWAAARPTRFSCAFGHKQPTRTCSCGLYAWASIGRIAKAHAAYVRGAVVAWGHLVIHGVEDKQVVEGFRAEWARPVALVRPKAPLALKTAQVMAESMGVPLVPFDRLEAVAREFGVPLLDVLP